MRRVGVWAGAAVLVAAGAVGAITGWAQDGLPSPSPAEKTLAERAAHVTEVTLDKNMLAFAGRFLDKDKGSDDKEERAVKQMIQGLQGVYVRNYEFEKEGEYTAEELETLRKYIQGSEWSPMVHEKTKGAKEGTDVYLKVVNGQVQGLFVLDAEPKEVSLVLILGPLDLDKIGGLGGNFGIPKNAVKTAAKDVKKAEKGEGK